MRSDGRSIWTWSAHERLSDQPDSQESRSWPAIQPRVPSVFEPSDLGSEQSSGDASNPTGKHSAADVLTPAQRTSSKPLAQRRRSVLEPPNAVIDMRRPPDNAPIIQPSRGQVIASGHETHVSTNRDISEASPRPFLESPRSSSELTYATQPRPSVRSRVMPAHELSVGTSLQHANTRPAPLIRVTIGRIDVRAVLPPAQPPRRTTSTRPKLTLDEYLKQRNGGR
jgi:hypothetical protein